MTRSYGTGSVYQRRDGRWIAQLRDKRSGKTVQRSAKSEREARKLLREMTSRVDSGQRAVDKSVTFRTYAEEWLEQRAERGRTGGTVGEYERILRRDVFPRIGGKKLGSITETDVENILYELLTERDLSASSLGQVKKAIAAVLTDAMKSKSVTVNVARGVDIPDRARGPKVAEMPTTEEVRALIAATSGTPLGRVLVVLAMSGARIGELLGATWESIDLNSGEWVISRTTSKDRQGRVILGDHTKSKRVRIIDLPPTAVAALREQRRYVLELRLAVKQWQDHDLIFPSERGTVIDPRNLRKKLDSAKKQAEKLLEESGAEVRPYPGSFHSMRHYFSGTSLGRLQPAEVQQLLGHSTLRMTTSVYGHLTPRARSEGPSAVAAELGL